MMRKSRSVAIPLLVRELCVELHALVGESGHGVLVEALQLRLGVGWDQLTQALALARQLDWIEARGSDSVALLPAGAAACRPTRQPTPRTCSP